MKRRFLSFLVWCDYYVPEAIAALLVAGLYGYIIHLSFSANP